jgi:hypothetical protein
VAKKLIASLDHLGVMSAHPHKADTLVTKIGARRQELDQVFFQEVRALRAQYGDPAVDRAMTTLQEQHDAVAVAAQRRGPQHFRKF